MNHIAPVTQHLISQFRGNFVVTRETSRDFPNLFPHEFIEEIETTQGIYYLLSTDSFSDFDEIRELAKKNIGNYSRFVEVLHPKDRFEDCYQSKYYSKEAYPSDFDAFKQYVYSEKGNDCFYFLIKK